MHQQTIALIQAAEAEPTRFQCRHIFTDGHRCGSPSLREEISATTTTALASRFRTRQTPESPAVGIAVSLIAPPTNDEVHP